MKPPALLLTALVSLSWVHAEDPTDLGPFGIGACHVRNRSAEDASRWVPLMQSLGLRYYRSGPTGWGQVQPQQGRWDWKALDEHMAYLDVRGFTFGGILLGSPSWNTLDKPGTLPVNNIAAWSEYVTAIVTHTQGRIHRWEVWNEPPNFTGRDQTPADYAKIVISAYDAAKKANPQCLIGLAAKSAHINYLEQVIKAGAKDHFDYITLHPYEVLNGIADNAGTESVFMHIVPTVRKMLAAHNPAKKDVPIIFTELGCDVKKGADTQAHALVKAYTMGIAQGVACIHWFEGMDGDSGPLGLIDGKGTPRPAYTAMGQMIHHLGQHPGYLGWLLLNEKHYAFVFQGARGTVLITWTHGHNTADLHFTKPVQLVDPLTGHTLTADTHALTVAPILALGVPDELITQAKANKDKPLPWDGDYTGARSVSITVDGSHMTEQGLHTRSGNDVAEAVVAYGGSARAGNIPGGNLFIVDPQFLSHTNTPIEITAVVRRNEANDNAGFKLVYESTAGLKTAKGWVSEPDEEKGFVDLGTTHNENAWYTIPDNKEWHTVRWQIHDAQFVNYWGYNFALESDGNQYNKYYLQSVTVKKRGKE